jgi:hypothetical protein
LQKCIALGFRMAIGFSNSPKRTIFDVWCNGMVRRLPGSVVER